MVLEELGGIAAIVDAIGKAIELFKNLPKDKATQEFQKQLVEVQALAVASNKQMLKLQTQNHALEEKLSKLEDFSEEKNRHELRRLGETVSVYVLKEEFMNRSGEVHELCPNCFADSKLSYLDKSRFQGGYELKCARCQKNGEVWS